MPNKTFKNNEKKEKKHDVILLTRSKSNNTEKMISKALPDAEITHEEFATIVNWEKIYHELKEGWRVREVI